MLDNKLQLLATFEEKPTIREKKKKKRTSNHKPRSVGVSNELQVSQTDTRSVDELNRKLA